MILKNMKILKKIKINIFSLINKDEAIVNRLSEANYVDTINLSLYKYHFSYITKLESFTKTFACKNCGKSWETLDHLKRHSASYTNEIKYKTVSNQIFKKNDNIIYK